MFFLQKVSQKISAVIFLTTIVVLSTAGFLTFQFTKSILEQSIMRNHLEITKQTMNKIDRLLNERILDMQDIAGADPLEDLLTGGSGREGLPGKDALRRLDEYLLTTGPWDLLMIVDRQGRTVLASDETQNGISIKAQPQNEIAYETAMREDFYCSDFVISENTSRGTVIFAAPVHDHKTAGNPVIGVVIGHFSWPAVLQVLEDVSAHAHLLNREWNIIGQNAEYNAEHWPSEKSHLNKIIRSLKQSHSKSIVIQDGEGMLGSFAPQMGYLTYQGYGWGLLLEKRASIVFAPASAAAFRSVALLIPVILAGSVLIVLLLNRWITKPISVLINTTRLITAGDITQKVLITSHDEMGELAVFFNTMIARLRASYEDLEAKVLQRTQELVEVNESLQRSEERNRLIIETANDAFITINSDGIVTDWNHQAKVIFGWSREEVVGKYLAERIIPLQYREAHERGLKKYLETGEGPIIHKLIEITALNQDGYEFPIEMTVWPIRLGAETSFNAFVRDITERKRLEKMVLQSEKMSAIGQLAAGVAHEINNPLGVVLGFSQSLVKRMPPGDPLEMPLKSIEREAVRCKNLVQDLLTFSREGKLEKESVDLAEAVDGALSLILAQSKVKNVRLVKEFKKIPQIIANKSQIQQIVVNLSNNAIDAMPNGGTLTIRLQKTQMQGQEGIEIQVQDTGQGIPAEIRSKIFDPFFTTKEIGKGTGLGLSLVHEIIAKHAGKIFFDSEPGRGTTFHVFLPLNA